MAPSCVRSQPAQWRRVSFVPEQLDAVAQYGKALGLDVRVRTVLVEGRTDADLFSLAAMLERESTGIELLGGDLAILPAGDGELGGTTGVIRELLCFRGLARTCLEPNGRPRYRFVGLFDNDKAGKYAVTSARALDTSIIEYKDVFRIWPTMPRTGNLDPGTVQKTFERENLLYKGLEWELEDLLPQAFTDGFVADQPGAIIRNTVINGKTHRDFSRDGKARFHRFVKQHAIRQDLIGVADVLKTLRFYLGLK